MLPLLIVSVMVYLLGNSSTVIMNITVTQPTAILNVSLPITPLGPVTVTNASGYPVPSLLVDNHLLIPVFGNGSFTIKYTPVVNVLPNGLLSINISSKYPVNLYVSNVLLSSIPINLITNFTKVSNGLIIQLAPGNYTIEFTPEIPTAPRVTTTTTVTNTTSPPTTAPSTVKVTKGTEPGIVVYIIPIVIVAVAALLIYLLLTRRRSGAPEPVVVEGLNPTDREVLKAIIEMGGDVYQADLQRRLNMPKATLWRSIRRLETAGYVRVIREGKYNRIKLLKRPE
ncbi:helix-turn-helix transcriptional regulator [Vulcanisaeta thermophila]|uniref:helix-turn-helix transcriptional regulator n=1 Tax=Vulcanisaeta thermophila TaxID=867917 RepID=UPI00085344B2|nr:MarR family transcriptional regulator [Vulcanisaeta thermophila]